MIKTNIDNCRFTKTILMMLVVLGHACAFWSEKWLTIIPVAISAPSIKILYQWLNSFHTYAFTLVSGYIFEYKIIYGNYVEYKSFLENKAQRLLLPYLFAMIIWVAPINVFFFGWDFKAFIEKYVLCINPSQLWFLWMLFFVFVIMWPLRKIVIEKPFVGWSISIVSYCIGLLGETNFPNIFCIWRACRYIVFFYIGMLMMSEENKTRKKTTKAFPRYIWIIMDIILFAVNLSIAEKPGHIWYLFRSIIDFALHCIGAIMAYSCLELIGAKVRWKDKKWFKSLSYYSMPIYLFHQQIIYFVILWLNGKIHPWIHIIFNFIIAVLVSCFISAMLMKWRKTRYLIGERNK